MIHLNVSRIRMSPGRIIPVSFLATILIGAVLLMLPLSSADGSATDFLTALFTATTSVCVTGLVVVDTYAHWSFFGQIVILVLIQVGGLGVVAVGSMIMMLRRKKFNLGNRMLLGDALNVDRSQEVMNLLIRIFRGVLIVEGIGALLCMITLIPLLGVEKGIWASIFQSVSAFCNAGMDVIGPDSMIGFNASPLVMVVTMALIVLGGLGFVVWFDLMDGIKKGIRQHRHLPGVFKHLPEHSKVVLLVTGVLLLSGAVAVFAAEYNNPDTIGNMSLGGKILNSFFQSVTFRTAGFATIPQEKMTELSCVAGYILMFIGGSPVGTAGGIKTVTIFLFFMNAISYVTGRKENVVFNRRVPEEVMRKAAAIVCISLVTVVAATVFLMSFDRLALTNALFEVISALGTVGLSRGVTPNLDSAGRIIIIVSMYLGRIGPISMAIFFAKGSGAATNMIKHADGRFYVG
ncbi:MAG: potassium transporter TrkH [Lachnospiraceae bacterium]|nr:potassium transporter TrkH [Lachnospiraceae bacterium]